MRILIISNLCPPHAFGGYERASFSIASYLAQSGHDIRLLTAATHLTNENKVDFIHRCLELNAFDPIVIANKSIASFLAHKSQIASIHNCNILLDHIQHFQPDIILFYNLIGLGGLALIDIANNLNIPWLFHLMDKVPVDLLANTDKEILSLYNGINGALFCSGSFISSKRNVQELLQHGIDIRSQTKIITVWTKDPPLANRMPYQQNGMTRFIFSGYICENKGVPVILQAANMLLQHGISNFIIDFYGAGAITHYGAVMADLGLQNHCHFHGQVASEKMRELFCYYDCLLFPTWEREPFGFVILESSATGCVPVITENCGAAETLIDGQHCIKTPRDAQALAKVMTNIINGEFNLTAIGKTAAENVLTNFHFNTIMRDISAQISHCISAGTRKEITHKNINDQRRLQYIKDLQARTLLANNT